jgi:hypothetical protein
VRQTGDKEQRCRRASRSFRERERTRGSRSERRSEGRVENDKVNQVQVIFRCRVGDGVEGENKEPKESYETYETGGKGESADS